MISMALLNFKIFYAFSNEVTITWSKFFLYINDGYQTLKKILMRTSVIAMHSILQLVGSCGEILGSTAKL
jgi:hypothetical protein